MHGNPKGPVRPRDGRQALTALWSEVERVTLSLESYIEWVYGSAPSSNYNADFDKMSSAAMRFRKYGLAAWRMLRKSDETGMHYSKLYDKLVEKHGKDTINVKEYTLYIQVLHAPKFFSSVDKGVFAALVPSDALDLSDDPGDDPGDDRG
ncbi:hypothetical protein GPECTOR_1g137 [Gonium pectorale]|uniref:Uncharacterized protein n=1 Tax=Gonium pectorale TaxID=33097 RepID=A0A150H3M7_GONPE|nr:hypothetical protein GPECTOR_1g137 [Gonium pectorale]|eukprot:KXZ56160.1 hypothetical protein GPECTOR_1g137 [Gonium pectorale]